MFNVVLALLPATLAGFYWFGLAAIITVTIATISCVMTEHLLCVWTGRPTTYRDWSAAVTGLLYGLTLPPSLPVWMTVLGAVIAIGVTKTLFGGLGSNCFNPALVGRAFLQAAFPTALTSWPVVGSQRFSSLPSSTLTFPFCQPIYDGLSGATPLSKWKFDQETTELFDLFVGSVAGSIGETSALLILVGGIYLSLRRMMNWRITLAILGAVFVCSSVLNGMDPARYAGPGFMLMLGAVFMATDMVASPMTHRGCVLYGVFIGLLIIVIRVWGGMPEGVMYAILLGNAISPHIDNWIQPRVYGSQPIKKLQAAATAVASASSQVAASTDVRPDGSALSNVATAASEMNTADAKSLSQTYSRPSPCPLPRKAGGEGSRIDSKPPQVDQNKTSQVHPQPLEASSASRQMMIVLVGLGTACGLAMVSAYLLTKPLILRNQIALRQQAVFDVLLGATSSQAFQLATDGKFLAVPMESQGSDLVYAGYDDRQQLVGIALIGQSTGYQDVVQLAYGYSFESLTILGFRVLASRETPGLGDRVESDENFLKNFQRLDVRLTPDHRQLANPIEFVKPGQKTADWQIDGITGATITSKTVTKILSEGSAYWVPRLWQQRAEFSSHSIETMQ
jgi:electron transport complex protein RnfD